MTRAFSPGGVPGPDVAAYYRRRAEGGAGLLVTEGTWVPHPGAANADNVPHFHGEAALAGWRKVAEEVHAAGGKIIPQLWHVGLFMRDVVEGLYDEAADITPEQVGPSGMVGANAKKPFKGAEPMTLRDIEVVKEAFATAAASAHQLGFDGVAFHGGHGYLFDQFFWNQTNLRTDGYGGSIGERTQFAREVLQEARRRTAPDFPLMFRMSQWKLHDYDAKLFQSPKDLEQFLEPMVDAGVDIFDCSQRRFWEPAFEGSDLNLAGWVRKISGKTTMTVGSVGLDIETMANLAGGKSQPASLDRLLEMLDRGDFDLVGVGRALLAQADWPNKIKSGAFDELKGFDASVLRVLS
jgi:2,4-dienoyl-CoA reductase-like NADH-dependent reductase (Old Yellow Enzyme family)